MIGGMKVKTSVTLSPEVLAAIDQLAGDTSRSEFIEQLLKHEIRRIRREERDRRDAEIYARIAREGGYESDVLDYSVDPFDLGDEVEVLVSEASQRAAG